VTGAARTFQPIVAPPARERAAVDLVVALAAVGAVAAPAVDRVVAEAAGEGVGARRAVAQLEVLDLVATRTAVGDVRASVRPEPVGAVPARERVVAGAGVEQVAAGAAADAVRAVATVQCVVLRRAHELVVAAAALQHGGAGARPQQARAVPAARPLEAGDPSSSPGAPAVGAARSTVTASGRPA